MMYTHPNQQKPSLTSAQHGQRAVSYTVNKFLGRQAVSHAASKFHEALKQMAMVDSDQVGYQNLGHERVKGLARIAHLNNTWVLRCPTASKGLVSPSLTCGYKYEGMRLTAHPRRRTPTGYTSKVLALCFTLGHSGVRCHSTTTSEGPMFSVFS